MFSCRTSYRFLFKPIEIDHAESDMKYDTKTSTGGRCFRVVLRIAFIVVDLNRLEELHYRLVAISADHTWTSCSNRYLDKLRRVDREMCFREWRSRDRPHTSHVSSLR